MNKNFQTSNKLLPYITFKYFTTEKIDDKSIKLDVVNSHKEKIYDLNAEVLNEENMDNFHIYTLKIIDFCNKKLTETLNKDFELLSKEDNTILQNLVSSSLKFIESQNVELWKEMDITTNSTLIEKIFKLTYYLKIFNDEKDFLNNFINPSDSIHDPFISFMQHLDKWLTSQNIKDYKNIPEWVLTKYNNKKVALLISKRLENMSADEWNYLNNKNELLIQLPWRKISNEIIHSYSTLFDEYLNSNSNNIYEDIYKDYKNYVSSLKKLTLKRNHDLLYYNSASIVIDNFSFTNNDNKVIEAPTYIINGAPGTGKTFFVEKLAQQLHRKFIKISLGGISQIGYFKGNNYQPSIILQKLKEVGVSNPIILLDEIDKMNPNLFAELLDVLDKKNDHFYDNFLQIEYDLSKIIFIGTSNYIQNIPSEIISRVKFVTLMPFTMEEKVNIGKEIWIDMQRQYGISHDSFYTITDQVIKTLIEKITFEEGVRKLKQELETLLYYAIANDIKVIDNEIVKSFYEKKLTELEYYRNLYKHKTRVPGMVNALSVNSFTYLSGVSNVICIHTEIKSNTPSLEFLSNASDVIKNSATIALRYVVSNKNNFNIQKELSNLLFTLSFDQIYIKSDGDSAGVAFVTSILSDLLNITIPKNVAFTGSIDLKGNLQPVGGIKEKIEGGCRDGVLEFFIPFENERDIKDIEPKICEKVKIHLIQNYNEIYEVIFNEQSHQRR
ncbi:S16 family serine protease [Mycoplasmopsis verecunda]|uniref:endopeptidase La n=1 Tax=Mycoplasmopsis verecunda TaxID=171291 RepID=A0A1T4LV55_9BACT|nr:S16 family serine protease [Mycoplasmopsis verecunda]WPB54523.1 S16 family serine protease [Mycoplasmopsis verecunda]SJZ58516.1 ATP-dependent Lon protease [Mycoplasmopsis verecunda]